MKKTKYYWHFLIPVGLYFPYLILNEKLLVDLFGCGCPTIDENGNILSNQFSANDVSKLFWSAIALAMVVISISISMKIHNKKMKVIYCIGSVILSIALPFLLFLATPVWK